MGGSLRALQGTLVSMQEQDRYCDDVAGSTINAMNTSTNINHTNDTTTRSARTTAGGFRRRCMAGAVMVTTLTAGAVGLAATSHADDGAPTPNIEATVTAPAPVAPWLPMIDPGCWRPLYFFNGRVHCG